MVSFFIRDFVVNFSIKLRLVLEILLLLSVDLPSKQVRHHHDL